MSSPKTALGLLPGITILSTVALGIIISEYIVKDDSKKAVIIISSIFLGIFFAVIEFRNLIKYQPKLVSKHITKEEKNKRLAMFVSDLFEEDIPFEELEKNKNQNEPIDP